MEIKIETNLAELPVWINEHVIKQATFATSVALYNTAAEIRDTLKNSLPENFTIRNDWVGKGIRVRPGTSKGIMRTSRAISGMQVEVGTVDAFMAMQELGGVKDPKKKAKRLAIPNRKPITELADRKKWPKAVLGKPGYFFWTRNDGRSFVFYRPTKKRYPIELKYSFAESVKIPPRWNLREVANNIVKRKYNDNFKRAFEMAMATAKR